MSENNLEEKLLKDRRVISEIQRHLWLESEKIGRDIGFDQAKEDWLKRFSKAWMGYHMPKRKLTTKSILPPQEKSSKTRRSKAKSA